MAQVFGRPTTATSEENVVPGRHMVMDDRRWTLNKIADAISISGERVENILRNGLGMTEASDR